MNKKIQCLIDGGFISAEDVIEHAAYLENQMNYYYEQYADEQGYDEYIGDDDIEDKYGQDEPDYPFDLDNERSDDPEYIVASTSYNMEETYIFEANEKGEILNYGEYGGLCKRHGDQSWSCRDYAVDVIFPGKYERVEDFGQIGDNSNVFHSLYKKITNEKN
jgi:hypothetical protein